MIEFFAPGIARPKGSKRMVRVGGGRTILLEMSGKEKPWRDAVRLLGMDAMRGAPPLDVPVELELGFLFPRPKSHFTKKGLRPTAPEYHTSAPDTSKLVRSVEDALNAVVFRDDSSVAVLLASKRYTTETPGVLVRVRPLEVTGATVEQQACLFE